MGVEELLFEDRAGNRLYFNEKNIFAKNKNNMLVNKQGVLDMIKRMHKAQSMRGVI